jgi:RpiB/LacA/LacB family sugar-phosphate isomerase
MRRTDTRPGRKQRVAIGCDHAGYPLKAALVRHLQEQRYPIVDVGTRSRRAVDYPDYAARVGRAIQDGRADVGVMVCGSGAGAAIAANKLRGVRAALCHDVFTAHQSREDDDANLICLGARVIGDSLARELLDTFLKARFSGKSRHRRRLAKVNALEARARG